MTPVIRVDHVTKSFRHPTRPMTLKEMTSRRARRMSRRPRLVALDDVSLEVSAGRTIGLVGPNGAGKSTLLRLIGGVGRPDRGAIHVAGRLSALLELGAGFHPDLTGREAAVLAGVIAGLSRRDVRARMDDIVAFSGLGAFIDDPLRVYSSGMQARLAFAIAVQTEPDVILVDEVLAVGDRAFQHRCIERLRDFQRAGTTVVLVSHDESLVADMCDRAVWLQGGRVVADGLPGTVVARYLQRVREQTEAITAEGPVVTVAPGLELVPGHNRFGSLEGTIDRMRLVDRWGTDVDVLRCGDAVTAEIVVRVPVDAPRGCVAVKLVRGDGVVCVESSTTVEGSGTARAVIGRLDLAPGVYDVTVGLYGPGWAPTWDLHERAYPLQVTGVASGSAVLAPPVVWEQDPTPIGTNLTVRST